MSIFYFHDDKMAFLITAFAILAWVSNGEHKSRTQLGYVIRLLQHRLPASSQMTNVMLGKLSDHDVMTNYRLSRGLVGEEHQQNLEYRYNSYVLWLGDSLRIMGCSEKILIKSKTSSETSFSRLLLLMKISSPQIAQEQPGKNKQRQQREPTPRRSTDQSYRNVDLTQAAPTDKLIP